MEKRIAIVGIGQEKAAIAKLLAEQGYKDVMIVTPEEAKGLTKETLKEIPITASPMVKILSAEKEFVCTGKHLYRNVNGEWICQCGRKTTD